MLMISTHWQMVSFIDEVLRSLRRFLVPRLSVWPEGRNNPDKYGPGFRNAWSQGNCMHCIAIRISGKKLMADVICAERAEYIHRARSSKKTVRLYRFISNY